MIVTLARVIAGSKSDAVLGIGDRNTIIDYIDRAVELAAYKAKWNPWMATMDICSDSCGVVTLPSIVGTVVQVNVGGRPTVFRNNWYEFHINGFGNHCGICCGYSTDMDWSPCFQDIREWSMLAAICEDAKDGDGSLEMIVEGETMDANCNRKEVLTIPVIGPSTPGVRIPLIFGTASTDAAKTYFRKITRVVKPITRGYVKLIAFPVRQMATAANIGYYAPDEVNPTYRRIKVGAACQWVRVRFRRSSITLKNDWDIVPLGAYQAILDLLKSIRLSDANDPQGAEVYLQRAVRLLTEVQSEESGSTYSPMQVDPSLCVGTIDFR